MFLKISVRRFLPATFALYCGMVFAGDAAPASDSFETQRRNFSVYAETTEKNKADEPAARIALLNSFCSITESVLRDAKTPEDLDAVERLISETKVALVENARAADGKDKNARVRQDDVPEPPGIIADFTLLQKVVRARQNWETFRLVDGNRLAARRFVAPLVNEKNWNLPLARSLALKPLLLPDELPSSKSPGVVSPPPPIRSDISPTPRVSHAAGAPASSLRQSPPVFAGRDARSGSLTAPRESSAQFDEQSAAIKKAFLARDYETLYIKIFPDRTIQHADFGGLQEVSANFLCASAMRMDAAGELDFATALYLIALGNEKFVDAEMVASVEKRLAEIKAQSPAEFQSGTDIALECRRTPFKRYVRREKKAAGL